MAERRAHRPTLGHFLIAEFGVVATSIAMLLTIGIADIREGQYLMRRCAAAQEQLTLATRIEADANAVLLARANGETADREIAALKATVGAYARATTMEAAMASLEIAGDENSDERASPAELAGLVATIERGPEAEGSGLHTLKALVKTITTRETREIAEAAQAMDRMQSASQQKAIILFALIALIVAVAGYALWRMVVRPAEALAAATAQVRDGISAARVEPTGIAELHQLGQAFNAMASDVERRVAERTGQLEAKNGKLAEIDRTRRLFFAKISHELRTPLTVMIGEAEVALRGAENDAAGYRDTLAHIAANGSYLTRRLDDLLATARSEDGVIQLEWAEFELLDVVRSAAAQVDDYARSSGVELSLTIPSHTMWVEGDPRWLRQAFLAVLDNAVKFAAGDGEVIVSASYAQGWATIAIADNGPGVAEADAAHIFDPYYQGDHGRAQGGSGLGLALAKWIVDRHGGKIMARLARRQGFVIEIKLQVRA